MGCVTVSSIAVIAEGAYTFVATAGYVGTNGIRGATGDTQIAFVQASRIFNI